MKLHIPNQAAAVKGAFPNHPRKIKKWLAQLPRASMGDMTRQIYNALVDLNRQDMAPKYRIEDLELFREPIALILEHLHKHFINRSLPLPEKSLKIVNLNQALLREIANGYKIMIFEAANGIAKLDEKNQVLSAYRAIATSAELILRASQIYADVPRGTWWDIHHIYAYMVNKGWHRKIVKAPDLNGNKYTVEDIYRKILLFSLSRPHALRHSETERVYNKLNEWNRLVTLGSLPNPEDVARCFSVQLNKDSPPHCVNTEDHQNDTSFVAIDTALLIHEIREQGSVNNADYNTVNINDNLTHETLRTLSMSWGLCAKRRFSRADKAGDIAASVGLHSIYEAIYEELNPVIETKPATVQEYFSLESIENDLTYDKADNYDPTLITHPNFNASMSNLPNTWDMVASGNVLTETFIGELKAKEKKAYQLHKTEEDLFWEVINISAGGYCLRWNSETTSKAQVGELIGIREKEPDESYLWRAGVIRWMQYTQGKGLEIGVQVLSPKVIIATVNRLDKPNETPFECLMLPGIKPIRQPTTLLLPAHAFSIGSKLNVHVYERDIQIKLTKVSEHTGSFTQFEFTQLQQQTASMAKNNKTEPQKTARSAEESTAENKSDDFDSIWSSI